MWGALKTGTHESAGGSARGRREQGLISRWLVPRSLHLSRNALQEEQARAVVGARAQGDASGCEQQWGRRGTPPRPDAQADARPKDLSPRGRGASIHA